MFYLGFDIGGTSIKAALVKNKKIIKSQIEDLPDNLEALLDLVVKIKNQLAGDLAPDQIGGIGFALAGAIDLERETMLNSPNILYLNNQPLKKIFEEKLELYLVKIENDVNCFLAAEAKAGLTQNLKNVFYLTLGTGVGGALMIDGKIISGSHGAAGEAGHMVIDIEENLDLEELAANKFIKKNLGINSQEAFERARTGDAKARAVFGELGQNLGVGLANIINIFDPEAIILSGGIADAKEFILPTAQEKIKQLVISPAARKTQILFSELGRFGGALGAALLFEKEI